MNRHILKLSWPAYAEQEKVSAMRVMVRATLDTEKSNESIRSGKLSEQIKEILDHIKPEAAYFGPVGGRRTCFLVFDMKDSSDMPPALEPFFTQFDAEIEVVPIMNGEDLRKGLSQLR